MLRRYSRLLPLIPALAFAFAAQPVRAEVQPGLQAVGYYINNIPPTRSDDVYPSCGSEVEDNINRNFDGEPFQDCGWDWFMVHYTGFITIPDNTSVQFMVAADDGGTINIDGHEFGTWNLKGCSWSEQVTLPLSGGTYPLDGWFFEAGGGTCYMLAWNIDNTGWEIVPAWAYSTGYTPPTTTTTTTAPTTTVPATTTTSTTLQETSTTEATTTTVEQTTTSTSTTLVETTSTSSNTTTTTTQAPQPVWVPQTTTTTEASTTTTTTSEPPIETTIPVQTTQPVSTTVAPQTTIPASTSSIAPTTSLTIPETTLPTTTIPQTATTIPTIQPGMSDQQILQQVTNPSVVESLSTAEAAVVFAALDEESVTEAQATLIIEALENAPDEVKEAFEENVNVFSGIWSSYKMVGQTISVAERVTLVAVANTMGAATAVLRRRNGT